MSEKELLQSIRNDPRGWLAEVDRLRARIAELEQAVESQVSEIADKGESISILRERVRIRNERIAELETERDMLRDMVRAAAGKLEAAQRPPLGYIVLAKRLTPTIVPRYTTAGGIWDEREPVDNHRAHCEDSAAADPERFGTDVEYIVAELRELTE